MVRSAWWLLAASWVWSCGAPSSGDGGLDGSVGGGDAGRVDAGLAPLALTFVEQALPHAPQRSGLVSDGATVYLSSTVGSISLGTLEQVVTVSTDEGRSFLAHARSPASALTPAADGGLYAVSGQQVLRSLDEARTFTPLTLPASVPFAQPPWLTVTADDALWVTSRGSSIVVVRSLDRGATFTELTVPPSTTRLEPCASRSTGYVALRNGDEVLRSDGGVLESLGRLPGVAGPVACHVSAAGTVLATVALGQGYESRRLEVGSTTWASTGALGYFRFVEANGLLVRWLTSGVVETSGDDGATWTSRVGSTPAGVVLTDLAISGTTLVGLASGGVVRHELGASAWEVLPSPGLPIRLDVVDLAFAADTGGMALLLEDNLQRTVYVAEDGTTWRRGRTLVQAAATSLALHPDGTQVFLGAADGTYRVLADAGTQTVIDSRIETAAGQRETNPIRQAAWGRAGGTFILVTTANDADTRGSVWQLNPDTGARDWEERRPLRTTTAAAVRPGGYHALAIAAEAPPPALTRSMLVALRSNVSTGSFLNSLLTRQPLLGSDGWWLEDPPPVGFSGAIAASINGPWGGGVAVLWKENRLWVGRLPDVLREVPLPLGLGEVRVVRFGKDGRLWLGGSSGLWRTATPVVID